MTTRKRRTARSDAYKVAKVLGDASAVQRGKFAPRIARRVIRRSILPRFGRWL